MTNLLKRITVNVDKTVTPRELAAAIAEQSEDCFIAGNLFSEFGYGDDCGCFWYHIVGVIGGNSSGSGTGYIGCFPDENDQSAMTTILDSIGQVVESIENYVIKSESR